MSSISEHYSRPVPIRIHLGTRDRHSRPRRRTAQGRELIPAMGPANRAPGMSIMGAAIAGPRPELMGGPDTGPRESVMGPGDRGTRLDLFGASDLRFVDSLFTRICDDR